MSRSVVRHSWMVLPLLVFGAVPAQAQLSDLDLTFHVGATAPLGDFAKFYDPGPSFRLDVGRPMKNFDVVLDMGIDRLRGESDSYVPRTSLWRYQVEVERDLFRGSDKVHLTPYVGAGGTSFRTAQFTAGITGPEQTFDHVYPMGTGGVRLGLQAADNLTWYLSGELNWSRMSTADADVLRTASRLDGLNDFSNATTGVISLGFTLHPARK